MSNPRLAAVDNGSGLPLEAPEVEQAPITEQDVQEYREQDRYLPVGFLSRNLSFRNFTPGP
jgi:hypothetical protein